MFSYTHDKLASVVDPPASVVVVDFEGGGRGIFDLTDRDPAKVEIGTRSSLPSENCSSTGD